MDKNQWKQQVDEVGEEKRQLRKDIDSYEGSKNPSREDYEHLVERAGNYTQRVAELKESPHYTDLTQSREGSSTEAFKLKGELRERSSDLHDMKLAHEFHDGRDPAMVVYSFGIEGIKRKMLERKIGKEAESVGQLKDQWEGAQKTWDGANAELNELAPNLASVSPESIQSPEQARKNQKSRPNLRDLGSFDSGPSSLENSSGHELEF